MRTKFEEKLKILGKRHLPKIFNKLTMMKKPKRVLNNLSMIYSVARPSAQSFSNSLVANNTSA
jgi:two-component sensor histidine kinase